MKAFPYFREIESIKEGYKAYASEDGMDLRDYFAAKAMQGLLAYHGGAYRISDAEIDADGAQRAYRIADAMMEARKQK
jgi:hypothetical protein